MCSKMLTAYLNCQKLCSLNVNLDKILKHSSGLYRIICFPLHLLAVIWDMIWCPLPCRQVFRGKKKKKEEEESDRFWPFITDWINW